MRGEREASIWVVVPAYNEASVIAPVVTQLIKLNYSVIIVDDGSTDRTGQVAALAGARGRDPSSQSRTGRRAADRD